MEREYLLPGAGSSGTTRVSPPRVGDATGRGLFLLRVFTH